MIHWLQNLLGSVLPNTVGQGAQTFEKKAKAKLINVTDISALTEEARKKSVELFSIIRKGGGQLDRLRLRIQARRKIKAHLAQAFDNPEIREEITEKILEAAKEDPFYKRLFS